jgi:hypothetical protein
MLVMTAPYTPSHLVVCEEVDDPDYEDKSEGKFCNEEYSTDLKRQPQVSGQAKYIVRARTEKVSVDANDQGYRERTRPPR